jgi:hypothetical protein
VEQDLYISFGLSESSDGKILYNAQVLINPTGEIQAVHRKRRPKTEMYSRGTVPVTVTDIKGVETGIVICSDAASPRTMWELMKNRLDLIILSLADDGDAGIGGGRGNTDDAKAKESHTCFGANTSGSSGNRVFLEVAKSSAQETRPYSSGRLHLHGGLCRIQNPSIDEATPFAQCGRGLDR